MGPGQSVGKKNSPNNSRKNSRTTAGKTAEQQPEKQLLFRCFYFLFFRLFYRDPLGKSFFSCFPAVLQCRAIGTSVDGHRDCQTKARLLRHDLPVNGFQAVLHGLPSWGLFYYFELISEVLANTLYVPPPLTPFLAQRAFFSEGGGGCIF